MRAFNFWLWPWPWYGPWSRYSNLLSDGNGDTLRKREGFLNQETEVTVSLHFGSFLLNFVLTKMVARLHHSAKTVTSVCQDKSPRVKPKVCSNCCCANTGKLGFKWNTTLANIFSGANKSDEWNHVLKMGGWKKIQPLIIWRVWRPPSGEWRCSDSMLATVARQQIMRRTSAQDLARTTKNLNQTYEDLVYSTSNTRW